MLTVLNRLFDPAGLTPHGFCLAWQPGLLWLDATSDLSIAAAYYSIPVALAVVVRRRRDFAYPWLVWLFALFITACGTTHLLGALTLWVPAYWPDGVVKAITAMLSLTTAMLLWPLIPKIVEMPSQSELQAINARLAESEARYRALFMRAPAAMHSVGRDRCIMEVSDAWLDLLGYTREEVIGQPIGRFQTPDSALQLDQEWQVAIRHGGLRDASRRFVCKSGEVLDILLSFVVEQPAGDTSWRGISVLTDITARTRTEAALRASEERLRQAEKLTALGQLAGGIAHDFNNILQTVQGGADLIRTRASDPPLVQRVASMILDAARRGASVSRRLLVFARHETLRAERIDVGAMLDGLRDVLVHTLGRSVSVQLDLARDLPMVLADRGQLETVLVNLATNARDAMPDGGVTTLSAHPADADPSLPPGRYLRIAVSDDGVGMDADTLARAGEPFFTTKPNGRGTGLGLSIGRNFAEQSGGSLTIVSRPGGGTTVTLTLPADAALPAALPAPPCPAGRTRAARVMLVDDEGAVREIIAEQLRTNGIDVVQAENGATALALLTAGEPVDLLISDLSMPGMDGMALIRAAQTRNPGLPALLLTGFAGATEASGFTVVRKPVSGPDLAERVLQTLGALV